MIGYRRRAFALFFSAILGVAGAIGSQPAQAQNASAQFVPYYSFLRIVGNAAPTDYVGRRGNLVVGAAAFASMRQYILDMYGNAHVTKSYVLDGQHFDCIPIAEQPSVRLLGRTEIASPPPSAPELAGSESPPSVPQIGPEQKTDAFGNSIGCTPGEIPMRRITLEELSRFETLEQFFKKAAVAATHKYAHSYQSVTNYGLSDTLNVWSPPINTGNGEIFSLSQHWVVASYPNGVVQTVEGGWQAYPQKYGTTKSVLFIYWTADGYNKTGCYNLDCKAFVQTSSSLHLGAGFSNYSTAGGQQYEFTLTRYLYNGNWWLAYGSTWVGYYPGSIYLGGPLATNSTVIDFGGEVVGTTNWPPMGGGSFASAGYAHAAYQRLDWYYYNAAGNNAWANLTPAQPSPHCYTDNTFNYNTSHSSWGTYFYFGGPGGTGC